VAILIGGDDDDDVLWGYNERVTCDESCPLLTRVGDTALSDLGYQIVHYPACHRHCALCLFIYIIGFLVGYLHALRNAN